MNEALRKKYIPMTETIYYTLLAVMTPRHGYAIMQYVSSLTRGRLLLGTGTLYTMVGRLTADGVIETVPDDGRKAYRVTGIGLALLQEETERLALQLADGRAVLEGRTALNGEHMPEGGHALSGEHIMEDRSALSGERIMEGRTALHRESASDRAFTMMGAGAMAEKLNLENRGGT